MKLRKEIISMLKEFIIPLKISERNVVDFL